MSNDANAYRARTRILRALSQVALVCPLLGPVSSIAAEADKAPSEDLVVAELRALGAHLRLNFLAGGKQANPDELRPEFLKLLDADDGHDHRASIRRICAANRMQAVKAQAEDGDKSAALPDVATYCLQAIRASARFDRLSDLYIALALQEQGRSGLVVAADAKLLQNNEPGQTRLNILSAAFAGNATYTGITGNTHDLPCPLALDAGYTFAFNNPEEPQPLGLSAEEAATVAHACYDPAANAITLRGETLPVAKAGLLAGAFLGRQFRLENAE